MTDELNTMVEARKKIEYCVKTCDDRELTEHGMEAVFDYIRAYNTWAKSVGKVRGPKPVVDTFKKKMTSHTKVLKHIMDGYEYADDAELIDMVWEYLPKLTRASKALVKAYQVEGIRSVA